ncbi:MAG: hypothetical protein JNK02_13080 [Planctomycetes bacterium]|nr:hypothetical protein [Planctomycetota bacterium]
MTPDPLDHLSERGRSLEEEFFKREDQKLIEKLRTLKNAETTYDLLAKATGVSRREILEKLREMNVTPEAAAALAILPFVEVAWADGSIDAKEREALLKAADERGFAAGTTERALLESWLVKRPEPRYFGAWTHTIQGLCEKLTPEQAAEFKRTVMDRARKVASISGGVLGFGKVSAGESAMLAKIEKVFDQR